MVSSRRSAALVVLALLGAAAITWSLLDAGGATPPAVAPGSDSAAARLSVEADRAHGAADGAVPADRAADRRDAETLETTAAPTFVQVRVVDAEQRPIAAAEVGTFVYREGGDAVPAAQQEPMAWAGELLQSDRDGELRIPIAAGVTGWVLYGRFEALWGVHYVPVAAAAEPQTLVLLRDLTVRARVLDAAGRPLPGVCVGFCDASAAAGGAGSVLRESTAPDGIATFEHAQRFVRPEWGGDAAVRLAIPLRAAVFAPLDLAALPAEPVELRLPATGEVVITLTDAAGAPIADLAEPVQAELYELASNGEREHWLPFAGNRLELRQVGLGLRFRLELSSAEVRGLLEFDGPQQPRERIEQTLVVQRQPTLSGRLVDVHGVPQQGYWWATNVRDAAGFYNQYFETGADGRFHTAVPPLTDDPAAARGVLFRRTLPDPTRQAWLDLAAIGLHDGRNELGDIVLDRAPLLAAGRVVDDAGEPVAGAELGVLQGDRETAWTLPGYDNLRFVSDAGGRFEIHAYSLRRDLMLTAALGSSNGEPLAFVGGATGIRYVLPRVGEVAMPVTFDGALGAERALFFRVDRATGLEAGYVAHYVLRDGVVHWRGIPPGRYDFGVRVLGVREPLVRIDDVEVRGGATVNLPAQELGAGLHAITLRIVGPTGEAVERASVVVDPPAVGGPLRAALRAARGEVRLLLPRLPCDLLVVAPGHRSQRLRAIARDTTVRLEAGFAVELHVALPPGFPAA
ncbi:MAG: hypothetical protein KDE27_31990, partial [Planctomycetes bacterium]|nr:hypothetical protein [Planctomycetota bacterium]